MSESTSDPASAPASAPDSIAETPPDALVPDAGEPNAAPVVPGPKPPAARRRTGAAASTTTSAKTTDAAETLSAGGEVLFTAYFKAAGGKNHRGEPLPAWADLGEDRQTVWESTASTFSI